MEQKDAEKAIQWIQHKMNGVGFKRMSQDQAAQKIQRCWRSYYNLRVYHFYRDLIRFREQGDPKSLLRFINPRESTLVEKSMGIHMRFRLGGEKFPPVIFYKIYVDRKLVDMNAFSPRDYTLSDTKMVDPVHLFNKTAWKPGKYEEWYQRFENNEWRPVLDSVHPLMLDSHQSGV
ncbi:hypothetical protein EDD86DRAFT_217863 [Gorgonomyces haynaldii]|nr:hypothetical protein EDD86DRAFT_217863 [Gorgonomyces haynaldii]